MAHFKCDSCRARVWRDGDPADHLRDLCPGCGGPVEHVSDLTQLVGLRALRPRRRAGQSRSPTAPQIAAHIRATIAGNDKQRR